MSDLAERIGTWFQQIGSLAPDNLEARRDVERTIAQLDDGSLRVAYVSENGDVVVNEWAKQAILMLFRLRGLEPSEAGPFEYLDKLDLKHHYDVANVRVVPGAVARRGSYLSPGVILMPSFVNIGAWVGPGTMVDTWATIGSCAQIGSNVHLAGGVGIGGVLEPPNASPVVIEDDAFIGSRCMITEGARVGKGSVLGSGTILNPSIPVIDAETGEEVSRGYVPDYCVAVGASRKRIYPGGEFYLPCVLIVRRLSEGERHNKAALNDVLRDHGIAT